MVDRLSQSLRHDRTLMDLRELEGFRSEQTDLGVPPRRYESMASGINV